jgi:hypothetical protein
LSSARPASDLADGRLRFKTARKLFDAAALEKTGKAFAAEKLKLDVSVHSAAAE